MKSRLTVMIILVCILLSAAVFPVSCGKTDPGSASELKDALEKAGFSVLEGKLGAVDVFGMVDAGLLTNCNYQNAGAPYCAIKLPPSPDQDFTCYFSDAPINPDDKGLFLDYRIRPDEAIVMAGKTPPECKYFGYDGNVATRWSDTDGKMTVIFGNYGDPINPMVIKTDGTPDDPYEKNTMIIMTADQGVCTTVRDAAEDVGYTADMINDYPIPSQLLNLGLGQESDTLLLLHRFSYPKDEKAGKAYLDNPTMSVFRVTPKKAPAADPFEMPGGRVRGNGDYNELALSHKVEALRKAILEKYQGFVAQDQVTSPWSGGVDGGDGLAALQEMQSGYGPGRDALYLRTTEFTLADDPDEFVIVYGVNHVATDKATYSNISVYGTVKANGVASINDDSYAGTAEEFLPGDPDAKYLYVWKFARSSSGDPDTTLVPFDQGVQGIDLDQPMFFGFRLYLEKKTKIGPAGHEVYFDRAIKFTK